MQDVLQALFLATGDKSRDEAVPHATPAHARQLQELELPVSETHSWKRLTFRKRRPRNLISSYDGSTSNISS